MKNELENGVGDHILTRFPPEPNAYLHIGHARAIINNFELSNYFGGTEFGSWDLLCQLKNIDIII